MATMEENVQDLLKHIEELHDLAILKKWNELSRDSFVFELERTVKRLDAIYTRFEELNRELTHLLEKNTPSLTDFLSTMNKDIHVLTNNLSLEKTKKIRDDVVNNLDSVEVPELYSSLQQKVLTLTLQSRYNLERIEKFLMSRKMPFVKKGSTAKNLLEMLQKKEDELTDLKKKGIELKRKSFFGAITERSLAEIESELNDLDKNLAIAVAETTKSLKTHHAQLSYVEGSFVNLKNEVDRIEHMHAQYTTKATELIRELKKERDFAKTIALEIETETLRLRSDYTRKILEVEDIKQTAEEVITKKFEGRVKELRDDLEEKSLALKHAHKLIAEQEKNIERLAKEKK